jgi:hypothetical protein
MYKTINNWTKESMIEHVKANFKGKSVKTFDHNYCSSCAYRGDNGAKCAVGMFIPDELYKSEMEGLLDRLSELEPRLKNVMPLDVDGLLSLQGSHDNSEPENTLADMIEWIERNVT